MKYPHQRQYWSKKRVGLLAALAVLMVIGGTQPQGMPDLLGQAFGVVLFTVILISLYNGIVRLKNKVTRNVPNGASQ